MKKIMLIIIRFFLPIKIRQKVRAWNQKMVLKHHISKISSNPDSYLDGSDKSIRLMNRLIYGWGNPDWSADAYYLIECAKQAKKTDGTVLECGSGLTTLIMALVKSDATSIVALEHHAEWAHKVREQLNRKQINNVVINSCLLTSYGTFDWYDISDCKLDNIALVICDGPPESTLGGRSGLLPLIYDYLNPTGSLILLDDFQRIQEQQIVENWSKEYSLKYQVFGVLKKYAYIEVGVSND